MSAPVVTTIGVDPGPVAGFVILRCAPAGIRAYLGEFPNPEQKP